MKWDNYRLSLQSVLEYDPMQMSIGTSILDDIMDYMDELDVNPSILITIDADIKSQLMWANKAPASVLLPLRYNYMQWMGAISVSLLEKRKYREFADVYGDYIRECKNNYTNRTYSIHSNSNVFESPLHIAIIQGISNLENPTKSSILFVRDSYISVYRQLGIVLGDENILLDLPSTVGGTIMDNLDDMLESFFMQLEK